MKTDIPIMSDHIPTQELLSALKNEMPGFDEVAYTIKEKAPGTKSEVEIVVALIGGGFVILDVFLNQLFTFMIKVWEKRRDDKEKERQQEDNDKIIVKGKQGASLEIPIHLLSTDPLKVKELVRLVQNIEAEEGIRFIKSEKN